MTVTTRFAPSPTGRLQDAIVRQFPTGVKIGTRNFGRDRHYPISNAFRTGK